MSEKRDAILRALQRNNAIDPTRLLDDEIDTAAAQLDGIIAPDAIPTDAQCDLAVQRGNECKQRLREKKQRQAEEKSRQAEEKDRVKGKDKGK